MSDALTDDSRPVDADQAALCEVYVGRLSELRRVVAGMGFAAADADDILQDVYVEAVRRPGRFHSESAAMGWLYRVTVNRCLLEFRRRARSRRAADGVRSRAIRAAPAEWNRDTGIEADEVAAVREALRAMDGELAAVLVLRYFCELDSREIGEILQTPPATVRGRLRAARSLLARSLTQEE